jgi:Tol biopolymer transport system component
MEQALEAALATRDGAAVERTDLGDRRSSIDRHSSARKFWTWLCVATFTVVVGALAVAPRLLRRGDDGHSASSTFATSGIGLLRQLAAHRLEVPQNTFLGRPSPDGRYLPYVDLNGDLCLQDLATGQQRRVTNNREANEGAGSEIAISPDGHTIAYIWRGSNGTNEIRLVNEDGSSPRALFRRSDVTSPNPLQWSADGAQILAMLETTAGSNQLALLSVASGTTRTIKIFDGGQYHFSLSPDAALVAFDQPQAVEGGSRDIFVMSTDDGVPHRVIEDAGNDLFPLWTRDGQLLYVSD